MPTSHKFLFSDTVSGETLLADTNDLPTGWGNVAGDVHGPKGLWIIAQRLITNTAGLTAGTVHYAELTSTPYPDSALDANVPAPPA